MIKLKVAHLTPTAAEDVVAVRWGDYISDIIPGGTGKFANPTGTLEYFGWQILRRIRWCSVTAARFVTAGPTPTPPTSKRVVGGGHSAWYRPADCSPERISFHR
jgi:hypothetical protein